MIGSVEIEGTGGGIGIGLSAPQRMNLRDKKKRRFLQNRDRDFVKIQDWPAIFFSRIMQISASGIHQLSGSLPPYSVRTNMSFTTNK